jgi:hypothetical protein
MSALTERLAREILAGIEDGYILPCDDTAAFLAKLQSGDDIIDDFIKSPVCSEGGESE